MALSSLEILWWISRYRHRQWARFLIRWSPWAHQCEHARTGSADHSDPWDRPVQHPSDRSTRPQSTCVLWPFVRLSLPAPNCGRAVDDARVPHDGRPARSWSTRPVDCGNHSASAGRVRDWHIPHGSSRLRPETDVACVGVPRPHQFLHRSHRCYWTQTSARCCHDTTSCLRSYV